MLKNVAIIGMGAVGSVYAKYLFDTYGEQFYVIANDARKDKMKVQGVKVNHQTFFPQVISSDCRDIKMDLILFAVKNYDLEQAIIDVENLVNENTILLPLLNGITASERLNHAYPKAKTLLGLSMGIDAIRTDDGVVNTDDGVIQFGYEDNTMIAKEVAEVEAYLTGANIKAKVFKDMKRMLWRKWMLNVGVNQVSAIAGAKFKYFGEIDELLILFKSAMLEVLTIAKASHVNLTMEDVEQIVDVMVHFTPEGKTSMLQDVEAGRRTELDYFAGTVLSYGKNLGIATPVNEVLYLAIKAKEKIYQKN